MVFIYKKRFPKTDPWSDILSERSHLLPQSAAHPAALLFAVRKLLQLRNSRLQARDCMFDAPHMAMALKNNLQVCHDEVPNLNPGNAIASSTPWTNWIAVLWHITLQFLENCFKYREDIRIPSGASGVSKSESISPVYKKVKIMSVAGVESGEEFSAFGSVIDSIMIHGPGCLAPNREFVCHFVAS